MKINFSKRIRKKITKLKIFTGDNLWQLSGNISINNFEIETPATVLGGFSTNIKIGAFTRFRARKHESFDVEIGRFCSIPEDVFIGAGEHFMDGISTHIIFSEISDKKSREIFNKKSKFFKNKVQKKTIIGHDVWFGAASSVKGGVTIGTGAIIGMGAVVTKDVPPYAIVVGNPAKILKYRAEPKIIKDLLESEWWEYDIFTHAFDFTNCEVFLSQFETLKKKGLIKKIIYPKVTGEDFKILKLSYKIKKLFKK